MVNQTAKRQPWPADPAQYPLTGPSSGPVYAPPARDAEPPLWVKLIGWAAQGVGLGLCMFGPFFLLAMCR